MGSGKIKENVLIGNEKMEEECIERKWKNKRKMYS